MEYEAVCNAVSNKLKTHSKRGSYKEYTDKERFLIGQHASLYDTASAVRKEKKYFPKLNESSISGFRKRHESLMKKASRKKKSPEKKLANLRRRRPTLLGEKFDNLVQNFLKAT